MLRIDTGRMNQSRTCLGQLGTLTLGLTQDVLLEPGEVVHTTGVSDSTTFA
jgi:hypothetical protein